MPPKKKAGGGKKAKKSGKKKGEKQPQLTLREAILAFQIEVKERDSQTLAEEFRILREKNRRLKHRNEQLRNEQKEHIKTLLKQARENDKDVEQATVVNEEEVEKALFDKISAMKQLIAEEEEVKNQIKQLMDQIEETNETIAKRVDYKDVGQVVHAKQISVLKKKLADMQTSFQEVSAHLDRSLTIAKEEIQQHAQSTLTRQKSVATEEAADSINKVDKQEIDDHKWLKKEIGIHTGAFEDLSVAVEALEKENLEIMQELFDCKVEDLNLARKFYLACANESSDEEEVIARHGVVSSQEGVADHELFDNYFHFEDEESTESPRLGPIELQLLSVVGTRKTVHRCRSQEVAGGSDTGAQKNLNKTDSEVWPVSERMLQTLVIK